MRSTTIRNHLRSNVIGYVAHTISANDIANDAVRRFEIVDTAVAAAEIAADSVGGAELAAGAVTSGELGAVHERTPMRTTGSGRSAPIPSRVSRARSCSA